MQFLKTLFWVAVAVGLVLFASANWHSVTVTLWGGLEADVKLPVLVLGAFLLGFLPIFLLYRARMWTMKRRMEGLERQRTVAPEPPPQPAPPAPASEYPIVVDTRTAHPS
ncbi:MAG TPA: LapA family protein [Allosphingosinicella sp.]|nr:LapA family protein [Allosphingosinicella sp.]